MDTSACPSMVIDTHSWGSFLAPTWRTKPHISHNFMMVSHSTDYPSDTILHCLQTLRPPSRQSQHVLRVGSTRGPYLHLGGLGLPRPSLLEIRRYRSSAHGVGFMAIRLDDDHGQRPSRPFGTPFCTDGTRSCDWVVNER